MPIIWLRGNHDTITFPGNTTASPRTDFRVYFSFPVAVKRMRSRPAITFPIFEFQLECITTLPVATP